jgi:dipeptidyl aminopeptidase/acylaminoacyl peptidase
MFTRLIKILLPVIILLPIMAFAAEVPAEILLLGPAEQKLPLHATDAARAYGLDKLLEADQANRSDWWPAAGDRLAWNSSTELRWRTVATTDGSVTLDKPADGKIAVAWLALYLDADRWMKAKVKVTGFHLLQVWLDDEKVGAKTAADIKPADSDAELKAGNVEGEVKLETGKHLLLIKTVYDPAGSGDWNVQVDVSSDDLLPRLTSDATRTIGLHLLLDRPKVGSVSVSPDGKIAAISVSKVKDADGGSDRWLELRATDSGKLLRRFDGSMAISSIDWLPNGKEFSYTQYEDKKATVWIVNIVTGETRTLLKDVENFSGYEWSPTGDFMIFTQTEKAEENKSGLHKLDGMPDRWPNFRDRDFLFRVENPSGVISRLTNGYQSTDLHDIREDGKKIIFTSSVYQYQERPYSTTTVYQLDLESLQADSLFAGGWMGGIAYSPDGKTLLIHGGPSLFGELGKDVPAGVIPNDYDTQAYLYRLADQKVEAITRKFDPSIAQSQWRGDNIYFRVIEGEYENMYRYNVRKGKYQKLDTGVEMTDRFDVASKSEVMVYTGGSATVPQKAFAMNLKKDKSQLLLDPAAAEFSHVATGKVEPWNFVNKSGRTIQGRIYYPPGFDASQKYPLLVYYYGGTSPVGRDFGGRYPKNYYAANGYVVYVLQPSGCYGFGQEFSALHVNDWGIINADEIIDGVSQLVADKPFINGEKVGCMGASYGGFMTMLIQTRTDMFAAAVSHAGISSLSSYWGEGFWGYLYSSVATANSFPWNRKDIYVDQSALFNADKIHTPLLMMHGDSDTNVPPGESRQLYAALKLLGREVELIEVAGQDHWILDYKKRLLWKRSIMAWFDRWLKDQPQWWNELYPEK